MDSNLKRFVLVNIIILTLLLVFILLINEKIVKVTIIDNILDGEELHDIGLAKFTMDEFADKIDYKIVGEVWSERKKILKLTSGVYGITVSKMAHIINPYTEKYIKIRTMVDYIEFTVKDTDDNVTVYLDPGMGI